MNQKGYNCGDPDGDFGQKTIMVLKSFQADNRLIIDGIYGRGSEKILEAILQE